MRAKPVPRPDLVCIVPFSYSPSQQDVAVFNKLNFGLDHSAFPHVARWMHHIASFSAAEKAAFGGAAPAAKAAPAAAAAAADDDDMFADIDEDEDAAHELAMAKIAAEAAKNKKPKAAVIAKSTILFDIKPFEAETDMALMEKEVRAIVMDGLLWGASKLADVAYGVKKLVMNAVVEDDKVSTDELEENIMNVGGGELVQSIEIVAFNKI